jgi:CheY-like chemotaxis protein
MSKTSKMVLIIDDDHRNIFALNAVLKSRGYVCLSASSGPEGLTTLARDADIGIVLLDMMMPEMDGYETLQRIRKSNTPDIPVIAVTAQAMVGDRQKCLDAGANEYVSKPVDLDHLLKLLDRFLK